MSKKNQNVVLDYFKKNKEQLISIPTLEKKLSLSSNELVFIIDELVASKKISKNLNTYKYEKPLELCDRLTGKFDHVNANFGFVRYHDTLSDIYVETRQALNAWDGDTVEVEVSAVTGKNPEGRITKILERGTKTLVGKIRTMGNFAIVKPDNKNINDEIFIAKGNFPDAKTNDLVIVEILNYPKTNLQGNGKVIEVLGQSGDNDAEMHAILAEFGLPVKFPKEVEAEAEKIPITISKEEIAKRKDFRDTLTITIDPLDAKDFDDAISYKMLDNGNFEIGVHIADVSHYVKPGTELQKEAYKRATSVYLVDRTVPMLPEKLSNGLCSLRPNEDKLVFSAVFELDMSGKIHNEWIGKAVIHSDRRYTYEEAQEMLENKDSGFEQKEIATFKEPLRILNSIAKTLRAKRFKNGAFNFESVEVRFQLDPDGKPIGLVPKIRKDAHKLVEEFMLLANKRVAEFIYFERYKKEKLQQNPENSPTMVYRVHEPPNPDKVETFAKFANKMGFKIDTNNQDSLSKSLNNLMTEIEGKPIQNVLESLAVRTMSKAKYTVNPLGHFGLAFAHYSHFTSPIRRYPDLMAHRLIESYLGGGKNIDPIPQEEACKHSSEREKLASEAERASIKYKQVEFISYQDKTVEYNGVVTGVTDFGIFVEIVNTNSEGMVRLADLSDDYYEYDANNFRVFGRKSGRIITFGDAVKVKIKNTDLERRSIDLTLTEVAGGKKIKSSSGRSSSSRKPRKVGGQKKAKKRNKRKR